ncbi:Hypothetical predicted protein [Mytilus galloprovincialis]|uniref:Uncharacterized protein n=1 Tax=Mytilus galloprovincialis TaxID=29158 RepID=A0A8B6F2K0_MYTGA|nr:Hypothetical predicted protein [Mytilus galloprovincialis]
MSTAARKQKQLNECLLWAADKNDTEKLRYYLKEGATVDKSDPYRRTCLIKATQFGNLDSFESLISHGASVDRADVDGETALTHASYKGCFDILCRLVELGADVNHKNNNDETPLYIASKYGHYDCVRRLVMVDGDYNVQSKFRKTALDVAIESLCKTKKLKKEEKCKQLERIVELLSDADEIQALRKQEKMFTLTPEEFRICLERSEYRPSDVSVRVIGLNDHSTMVVTRALIRQSTYSDKDVDIENGINIYNGMCELNIESGEWITHEKIADEDLVHRHMGEVVRHYVNTNDFKTEVENEASLNSNKQSLLFRSNTVFEPELPLKPFSLSPHSNGLRKSSSSNLLLPRSATSTSLYSLKSVKSVVSLGDMDIKMASGSTGNFPNVDEHVSSDGAQVRFKQFVSNTRKNFVKAAQTIQQKMDTLIHGEMSDTGNLDSKGALVKNRKHVYETFEHVKRLMDTNNSNLASISVCSLSTKLEFAAAHKFLFTSSAIYIVVLDLDIEIDGFCSVLSDMTPPVTNKDYIKYLMNAVTRRNEDSSDQFSKMIFVVLNSGSNEERASQDVSELLQTMTDIADNTNKCDFVIIDNELEFTLEDLYTDKIMKLTRHISSIACKTIESREPVPATWLSLQEVIFSTRKNSAEIISQKGVVELCINQAKHITMPTKLDVEKFLKYQTSNGNLLSLPSDGALNNLCVDISILYKLDIFFNHVSIMLSNDKYECAPLYEKLLLVSEVTSIKVSPNVTFQLMIHCFV